MGNSSCADTAEDLGQETEESTDGFDGPDEVEGYTDNGVEPDRER